MPAAKLLFCLYVLASSLSVLNAQGTKASLDKVIAVVGDRIILQSEINSAIRDAKAQDTMNTPNLECSIIEQTVVWKILVLQAEKDSIMVSVEDVDRELDQTVRRILMYFGSQEEAETRLGKTIIQFKDDNREIVRENILAESMKQQIAGNVTITPAEVKAFFETIPSERIPYIEPSVEVGQIIVLPKASRDIEQHIVAELNNYKRQIQSKMASFEQVAKRFSDDLASKERGGLYQINRNEEGWGTVFMSAAFRLREGEISAPVKSKFGYHLIQLIGKNGDDITIRSILRIPPITDAEMNAAKSKLDSIRAKILTGTMSFNEAFKTYGESTREKMTGPFILNRDGSTNVTLDELDGEMVTTISTMKAGDYSTPQVFTGEQERKALRIVYLKSRSAGHRMNMRDDYVKISQLALDQKRNDALQKWLVTNHSSFYVQIDPSAIAGCAQLAKYASEK